MDLNIIIEELRDELKESIALKGISHPDTIEKSQDLDKLIAESQRRKLKKVQK